MAMTELRGELTAEIDTLKVKLKEKEEEIQGMASLVEEAEEVEKQREDLLAEIM